MQYRECVAKSPACQLRIFDQNPIHLGFFLGKKVCCLLYISHILSGCMGLICSLNNHIDYIITPGALFYMYIFLFTFLSDTEYF